MPSEPSSVRQRDWQSGCRTTHSLGRRGEASCKQRKRQEADVKKMHCENKLPVQLEVRNAHAVDIQINGKHLPEDTTLLLLWTPPLFLQYGAYAAFLYYYSFTNWDKKL